MVLADFEVPGALGFARVRESVVVAGDLEAEDNGLSGLERGVCDVVFGLVFAFVEVLD